MEASCGIRRPGVPISPKGRRPGWRRLGSLERLEDRRLLAVVADPWPMPAAEGEGTPVADFALTDINETSARWNQSVSPRDYLGQVTGWYFGHGL